MKNKELIISHTGLDGITAGWIMESVLDEDSIVDVLHIDYDDIAYVIEKLDVSAYVGIYIANLNLTIKQADILATKCINKKLALIDNHKSGKEVSEKYNWYHLDTRMSVSMAVYKYYSRYYKSTKRSPKLDNFTDLINSFLIASKKDIFKYRIGKALANSLNRFVDVINEFIPKSKEPFENADYYYAQRRFIEMMANMDILDLSSPISVEDITNYAIRTTLLNNYSPAERCIIHEAYEEYDTYTIDEIVSKIIENQ